MVVRRVTISGAKLIWPLSATWPATSARTLAPRGTMSAEPALISMRGGMLLRARRSDSPRPTRWAASATLMVEGTVHTVQLAYWPSSKACMLRRSEEHTSELQSPCNLVCRLLLEKKKKKHTTLRLSYYGRRHVFNCC